MAKIIRTAEDARELAAGLLDRTRKAPWLVISTPNDDIKPVFDLEAIKDEVDSVSQIFVVWGGPATRELQELLPADTHVFGGAARTYPIDFAITNGASAGKLRYVYPPGTVGQSTARLISDVWAAANEAGLLKEAAASAVQVTGEVAQFYGDSVAVIKLTNGQLASIRQEATFPGVPLTWVFSLGQKITGKFDASTRIFTLAGQDFSVADAVSHFGYETVTLGLIKETSRKHAVIAIHPNLDFEVTKAEITGNPHDVINEYLRVGEVWPVRIYRDPQGRTRLKMNDIDDDESIAEAVSLLPGGQPWLDQARYADFGEEASLEPEAPAAEIVTLGADDPGLADQPVVEIAPVLPGLSPAEAKDKATRAFEHTITYQRGEIKRGNLEIQRLNNQLNQSAAAYRELNIAFLKIREEASTYKQLVAESRKSRSSESKQTSGAYARRDWFEDLDEWFREELRRGWLRVYTPDDRRKYPLRVEQCKFGDDFFNDVNPRDLDESELRKLIRVVIHLVTGRNGVEKIAESHELRVNNKPLMRGQDVGLRMHIENGQPGAKRLHYFKLAAGGYELTNVGNHDDYLD
jgi:hypothetical protein